MDIKEKLQEIFRDLFDDKGLIIFNDMTAEDVDGWDSLTNINLIADIEKYFGIRFTTNEITKTKKVSDFISLIERKKK